MGCLLFKESKLNFLENLKTEGYINSRRELTFEKDVHKYLNDLVNRLNLNYDLNIKSLATIKEVKIKTGKDFSRDSEKFILTPIEESFEQIDNRRKELGIYEDKISIGEYNKTQIEKISNQEKVNRLNFFNGDVALYEQEQKEFDNEANLIRFSDLRQELRVQEGKLNFKKGKISDFEILSENLVIDKEVSQQQAQNIFNKKNKTNQDKKDLSIYFANYFLNSIYDKEGLLHLGYTRFLRYGITPPKLLIVKDNGRKNPFFQYNNVVIIGLDQIEDLISTVKTPSFEKFENLINTVAQEEIIHLYADYILDHQDIDNIYNEMTEKDIEQIKKIYGNSSIQKENIVHEYVRMVVQQRVFGKTTEYETFTLSNAIMSFFENLLERLNDFLSTIIGSTNTQKAIEDVINFTKGNFSKELDDKIVNRVFNKGQILEANLNVLNNFQEEQKELDKIVENINNIKFDENGQGLLFGNLQNLAKSNRIAVGEIKVENKKITGFNKKPNPYLRDYNTDLTEVQAKKLFEKTNKSTKDYEGLAVYFANMFVNEIIDKDVHLKMGYMRLAEYSQQKPKILITDTNKKINPFYQYNNTIIVGIYQLQQLLENGNYSDYQKFTNLIQSVAQEESIHLFAEYLLSKETVDNIYSEMSEKDIQKIKDIYENENLDKNGIVHEYVRMAVQQHVFNSTTEQEKIKLNNSILAFISKMIEEIQQFLTDIIGNNETKKAIEDVINFTKGNFSKELDQKIINKVFEQGIRLESNLEQINIPFQQFQQSLNKPNTNPILQGNQEEQVKKFAELQERLSNKEFLEGAKNAFESSEELQNVYYEAAGFNKALEFYEGDNLKIDDKTYTISEKISSKELAKRNGLTISSNVPVYIVNEPLGLRKGGYDTVNNIIILSKNSDKETIHHELIHSVEYNLDKKEIEPLYQKVKNTITEDSFNDFVSWNFKKSISEFIADALSKKVFRDALKKEGLLEEVDNILSIYNAQITPQQKLQALNAYSSYIARVSLGIIKNPSSGEYNYNSQAKDIVYHGTDNKDIKFYKNNTEGFFSKVKGGSPNAIFFSKDKAPKDSIYNRAFTLSVLLNLKNPFIRDDKGDRDSYPENYKTTINNAENNGFDGVKILNTHDNFNTDVFVVFEPEQIHILSSKADIQGFKNFMAFENDVEGFKEFVQEEKDDLKPFIDESNKIGEQIRDVENRKIGTNENDRTGKSQNFTEENGNDGRNYYLSELFKEAGENFIWSSEEGHRYNFGTLSVIQGLAERAGESQEVARKRNNSKFEIGRGIQLLSNNSNIEKYSKLSFREIWEKMGESGIDLEANILGTAFVVQRILQEPNQFYSRLRDNIEQEFGISVVGEISLNFNQAPLWADENIIGINLFKIDRFAKVNNSYKEFIDKIDKSIEEEIIHLGINQISTKEEILQVYNEMSSYQKKYVKKIYGYDFNLKDEHERYLMAHEFIRMIIQDKYTGSITESSNPTLFNIINRLLTKVKEWLGTEAIKTNEILNRFDNLVNKPKLNLSEKSKELKSLPNNQWFNRTIQPIINRFSKMFPNVRSVVISEKEIPSEVKSIVDGLDKQINSFFHKGQVYIIKERVTKDIAIEEFLHPFVNALEQDNPELYKSLLLEAKKLFPELKEEIFSKYGKVYNSIFDLNREFLTQALTKKVSEQTPEQETWFSKFKTWIRDILDRLFGSDATIREISMLDETMSLTDLASILNENNTKFNFNSTTNTTYYSLSEEEVINYLNRPKNAIQAELLDKILANNKVTQTDFVGDKHEYTRNELGEILQLKPASSLLPEYKSDKIFEDFAEIGNVIHDIVKSINVDKIRKQDFIAKNYESSSLKQFLVIEKGFPDATAHQIISNLYDYLSFLLSKDSLLISEISISHLQDIDDVFKGVAETIDLLEIKKDGSMVIHDFKSMYINTDEEKTDNKEATQAKQKFNKKSNRFGQQLSICKKLLQSITNSDKISLQVYPIFYLAKTETEGNRTKVVFNNELNKKINFFTDHNNYIYDNIDTLNFNDSIKQYAIEYNKKFADKVLPSIKDELPKKTLSKIELDRQELLNNLTDKIKEDNSKALEIEIEKVFKLIQTVTTQYGKSENELNKELFKIFDPKGELRETNVNFEIIFKNIKEKKGDELKQHLSTLVQYINFIQETNEGLKNIKNHFHVIKAQEKTDAEKIADYRKSYLLAKTHKERIAQTLHQLDDISDDNLFKKMIKESIALIEEIEKKYDRETLPLIANVLNSYITPEFRDNMTKELKDRIAKEKYDLNLVTSESSKKSILNKIEDLEKQLASFEDPNLITKIIKGEYGDGHWFYSSVVANINNPNYVISGTAVMMQHILHDIAMEAVKVEEEFGRQFRQREEAYGVNRDQVKEMNKDMVTTVQRVFEKPDGTIETLDSMQFIVEVNQQVYEDHKKLGLLYKNAKTDEEKEKALKDIKDFEKLHFESKYNPKYLNVLNKLDVTVSDGRNVMEVRQKILDNITAVRLLEGKEEYKEGNISPENLETLRELTRELFNLSSSFDRNGNKKQGADLEIAEILQNRSKELEEFREKKVDEELWKKLKTQKIQSLLDKYETEEEVLKSEEYKQWQSYNSSISPTEDFYTERKEKLDKINSILDKKEYKDISLVSQLKDNLNQSWERLIAISREYRDFEREVIAQDVPEGTRKAMKILEENIDKVKQQIKGLEKSLSKEDKKSLKDLWESYNSMVEYKTSKYYTEDLEIALNKYALENDIDVSELRSNSSLMTQFRLNNEWYVNSHITKERFDKETGETISYTEPVYYYKVIIPTNPDYIKETPAFQYSTFELKDEAYNLDEEGKPNYLDVFGRPKIKKTSKYITENIPYLKIKNDLSTKGKINFENIRHITTQLEEVQKDLNKNNLIYYQVPSKFKSTFERSSEGDFKSIKENLVDNFFRMTNDEKEFGTRGVLANLSGEEMQFIPVLGKYKLDFKDQSYDVWQSSLEYIMSAKKAKMFEEKLPILDALVDQLEKNNPVEDPNKVEAIGNSMAKKFGLNNVTEAIKGKGTNTLQAVKDEISKGVYEEFTKELANWRGISDVKITNTVLGFAGTTMMIGKIANWTVNAMSGNVQVMIESAGKRYYTPTDVKNAKIELTKKSKEVLEDISKISDKSLIGQLTDFFDPMKGEFIDNLGNKFSWSKRTNLHKIFFFGKIFGEWEMQMTSFIAMLKAKKVHQVIKGKEQEYKELKEKIASTKDSEELKKDLLKLVNVIDLYDAFERGEDGVPKLKEGVQFSERELVDFKLKIQGVNKMLNGSYAKIDQTKIEKYSIGKATMFMKKYLIPLFIQRFGGFRGDMELQDAREGHYRIFYNVLLTDIKNLGLGNITEIYAKMNKPPGQGGYTDLQKQAIKKTLAEFAIIALIFLTLALLGYDDDEDDSDTVKFAQYIALKLKREVGLFTPLAATQELSSLIERPFIAMGAVSNIIDLTGTVVKLPFNWAFDAFEDDLYYQRKTALWDKGDSKLLSLILKTAGLQVAITEPEQLLQSYKYSIR